jgi:hypothetical protein
MSAADSVYLRAAERIAFSAEERYARKGSASGCCQALANVRATAAKTDEFVEIFGPDRGDRDGYWWRDPYSGWNANAQQARVLALLFMHWMTQ